MDVLWVPVADDEDDDRIGHHPVVAVLVPIARHDPLLDERRDVRLEGERDDVRAESSRDGARLVARGAVGLIEGDVLACRGCLERRDYFRVRVLWRGVGDEAEGRTGGRSPRADGDAGCQY